MIILGIDHSTVNTGAGVIEAVGVWPNITYKYITHAFFTRPSSIDYPKYLEFMAEELRSLLAEIQPGAVAFEAPKDNRGFETTKRLTELLGTLKYVTLKARYPFVEIPPSTMKKCTTGFGNSDKEEVAIAVAEKLGLKYEDIVPITYYKSGEKKGQVKSHVLDGSDALGLALSFFPYIIKNGLDYKP